MRKMLISAALVLGTSSLIAPATAQPVVTGGLVNVTITDPAILNNLGIQAQVPVTVQVPVSVAANVCGVSVAVLGAAGSAAKCEATSGSEALADVVNRQLQRRPATTVPTN
jgi:hypothetical protein